MLAPLKIGTFQFFVGLQISTVIATLDNRYLEYWPKTFHGLFWSFRLDIQICFSHI